MTTTLQLDVDAALALVRRIAISGRRLRTLRAKAAPDVMIRLEIGILKLACGRLKKHLERSL